MATDNKVEIFITAKDQASAVINKSTQAIKDGIKDAEKQTKTSTNAMLAHWKSMAAGIALTYGVYKTAALVKDTALLAARFETLGIVMNQVGKIGGYSAEQMNEYDLALRKTGISMIESRSNLTKMVQAHLDLNKATELGRVAQNAAVIADINSSEAFARMIHGIQSGNTMILRNMGIMVSFDQAYQKYADTLGKTTGELTEAEKSTARMNAVLEKGKDIAGVYEAAMMTAGKKLSSFTRYIEDFKVQMGTAFGPATVLLVDAVTETMKQLQIEVSKPEAQEALKQLSLIAAEFVKNLIDLSLVMAKIIGSGVEFTNIWIKTWQAMGLASSGVITWSKALTDGVDALEKFGTETGRLELKAELLKSQIEDLKELTEGRIFTFRGDKEELAAKQEQLKKINELILKIKETSSQAGITTPGPEKAPVKPAIPTISSEEIIKNMQLQETFALKMADEEQKIFDQRNKAQLDATEIFRKSKMRETELAVYNLDAQFLAYDSFVQDKAALDAWHVEEYNKILKSVDTGKAGDAAYTTTGKMQKLLSAYIPDEDMLQDAYDIRLQQIEEHHKKVLDLAVLQADSEKATTLAKIEYQMAKDKAYADFRKSQSKQYLDDLANNADTTATIMGNFSQTISMLRKAGLAENKEMFRMMKGLEMASTLMNTAGAVVKVLNDQAIKNTYLRIAMAVSVGAMGAAQLAIIAKQDPGYEKGGIIYPNGDRSGIGIRVAERQAEAVVPLPDGRSIPVDMRGGGRGSISNIYIQAIDPKSFSEVIKRNPESIIKIITDDLDVYGPLTNQMRGTLL